MHRPCGVGQARARALGPSAAGTQRRLLLRPSALCRGAGGQQQQQQQQWHRRPSTPSPAPLLLSPIATCGALSSPSSSHQPPPPLRRRLPAPPQATPRAPPPSSKPQQPKKKQDTKKGGGWRVLDGGAYLERWDVPWSGGAATGWMISWFATFALSAFVLSPALYFALFPSPTSPKTTTPTKTAASARGGGEDSNNNNRPAAAAEPAPPPSAARLSSLPPAEQAQFALASEAVEASLTAALLGVVAARHAGGDPDGLSARGLLQLFGPPVDEEEEEDEEDGRRRPSSGGGARRRPARALQAPRGWLGWGLIGALAAPVVVGATATLLSFLHYDEYFAAGRGTADAVAGMVEGGGGGAAGGSGGSGGGGGSAAASAMALVTYVRLFAVTAVLAPLLEESVFRGFLLPSLTKRMPVPAAVVLSSAAFAAAHLSLRDAPVLFALGCLLGAVYVRSRALASPMLVHGLWNGTVLTVLFALSASGVDLDAMLHPAAASAGGGAATQSTAASEAALLQWLRPLLLLP